MDLQPCYTNEWQRSNPDFVVYLPKETVGPDTDNVHFLVTETPGGDLLGCWTQATYEGADNSCVVCARSKDKGVTWSAPIEIDGPEIRFQEAKYAFPIVSQTGRIYYFYLKHTGIVDVSSQITGIMRCRYSDDDGYAWSAPVEVPFHRRQSVDHPDANVPPNWIAWCKPVRDPQGRWIEPFTRWPSPACPKGDTNAYMEMMRFDNIEEGPDPKDIRITWLPEKPIKPVYDLGLMEPCIVILPDGRFFMVMRTNTGSPWYTISEDGGLSWRDVEPLRYCDGGERILHPASPAPLYALKDGRYLLQFHNDAGASADWESPLWTKPYGFCRRSLFLAVGEFRSNAHQPIWFSRGKRLADSEGVPAGLQYRTEMGTYASLAEKDGQRVIWYPDRKHFLLGKRVTDEWLADMHAPSVKESVSQSVPQPGVVDWDIFRRF